MNKGLQTLIDRGFVKDCTDFDGLSDLMDREPVTFYCGVDPTGPSLHVGHIVPFFAMHHLQEAGNNPIALVGGGTGLIGTQEGITDYLKQYDEPERRIKEECNPQEVYFYEYNNHECMIAWDGDLDAIKIIIARWGVEVAKTIKRFNATRKVINIANDKKIWK